MLISLILPEIEEQKSNLINLLIKEISRDLLPGEEYKRLLMISGSPPILLIRNPLLSVESKIKAILKGLNRRVSFSLQEVLHRQIGTIKVSPGNETQTDELSSQMRLLDHYALSKGFNGWQGMLEETFKAQDYKLFEEICKVSQQ